MIGRLGLPFLTSSATWIAPRIIGPEEITDKLTGLSRIDLAKVDAYERKNQNRTTVLSRVTSLRSSEPWAGYDELTAAEVQAVLSEGDDERVKQVRAYERSHKNRVGVMKATERELANA